MKKLIKIILIFILVIVTLMVGGCSVLLGVMNHRKKNYYKYSNAQGKIEKKYAALGDYEISFAEFDACNNTYDKFEAWYPSEMKNKDEKYPLVVMANGTGFKASKYKEVFKHLASWGFIVIGNEDENSRSGASSADTLDFFLQQNEDKNSSFFGKIDTSNIGITGHSQGGVGAINAVTEQSNGAIYKAIFSVSATSRYHADELNKTNGGWNCDLSKINIPIFMIAGTGFFDAGNMMEYSTGDLLEGSVQGICPLWWLSECYEAIPDSVPKVTARQINRDHGDMIHSADGYMTAWFMYWLQDDAEAGSAFFGENAEIITNANFQDIQVNP